MRLILLRVAPSSELDEQTKLQKMKELRALIARSFMGVGDFLQARRCKTHVGLLGPQSRGDRLQTDDLTFLKHLYR